MYSVAGWAEPDPVQNWASLTRLGPTVAQLGQKLASSGGMMHISHCNDT